MSDYGRWFKRDKLSTCSKTWVPFLPPHNCQFPSHRQRLPWRTWQSVHICSMQTEPCLCLPPPFVFITGTMFCTLSATCSSHFISLGDGFVSARLELPNSFQWVCCISMNGQSTRLTQPLLVATHKELFFLNLQPELKLFHLILFKFCVGLFSA